MADRCREWHKFRKLRNEKFGKRRQAGLRTSNGEKVCIPDRIRGSGARFRDILSFLGKDIKVASFTLAQILTCVAGLLLVVGGILLFCGKGGFASYTGLDSGDCKNSVSL